MDNRRDFMKKAGIAGVGLSAGLPAFAAVKKVEVLNPLHRNPLSFIIDDSTTLVNMAHFGIPQFGEVFPENYKQDWRSLPREIPDSFVIEFAQWCHEQGVKGKYSIVPYPACTGWVHRFIPGWTKKELQNSLEVVRRYITPDWDIHPEMISHTRVIDIKKGIPYPFADPNYMENWGWSQDKSADELAAYQAYALNVLKEAGLYCEGITTPGGYGSNNKNNLALGTMDAVREVYGGDVSHYFRDLYTEPDKSVAPLVQHASGLDGNDPKCVVSIIGCTEDWFGDWDGLTPGSADKMITADLKSGRLVEVIERGEPAIMVSHWPGIYYNGTKHGFNVLKTVVSRLNQKYNNLIWMKNSDIARYWAAREHTKITYSKKQILLEAPFAARDFTIKIPAALSKITLEKEGQQTPLKRVDSPLNLKEGTFVKTGKETICSFLLEKGKSILIM
ncbi:MAG: twin-arginine translocation signal domain-containing protein [Cyclobacteriaceae bacterium]|nr:twin-arginine translocation signal domain-containing protein [Cyclobacteriaceae bacterium]